MKLYVGNVPFASYSEPEPLEELFQQFGEARLELMTDEKTLRPRGWGFVHMSEKDAKKAEKALDGYYFEGHSLAVAVGK